MTREMPHPIILYDGVCGLCNRFVQFILRHDHNDQFRFAALQSNLARTILKRQNLNPDVLDTVYVVFDCGESTERVLARNEAASAVLKELGALWRFWASILDILPRGLRDWRYALVARNRYRFFGKYETCPVPKEEDRHKFLDTEQSIGRV